MLNSNCYHFSYFCTLVPQTRQKKRTSILAYHGKIFLGKSFFNQTNTWSSSPALTTNSCSPLAYFRVCSCYLQSHNRYFASGNTPGKCYTFQCLVHHDQLISNHVKLQAPRTIYVENYVTQRIYVTCGVWHGRSRCKIMPERQAFLKNSLIVQDDHVAHTLTG